MRSTCSRSCIRRPSSSSIPRRETSVSSDAIVFGPSGTALDRGPSPESWKTTSPQRMVSPGETSRRPVTRVPFRVVPFLLSRSTTYARSPSTSMRAWWRDMLLSRTKTSFSFVRPMVVAAGFSSNELSSGVPGRVMIFTGGPSACQRPS